MASVIIRMDDDFKKELAEKAKEIGLSLSAYIRSTMKEKIQKNNFLVRDQILADTTNLETIGYDDLMDEINNLKC